MLSRVAIKNGVCLHSVHFYCNRRASVDSMNDEAYALNMLMCCKTRSDCCRSIKVSIILRMLSVESFFAVSVASAVNRSILCYSE